MDGSPYFLAELFQAHADLLAAHTAHRKQWPGDSARVRQSEALLDLSAAHIEDLTAAIGIGHAGVRTASEGKQPATRARGRKATAPDPQADQDDAQSRGEEPRSEPLLDSPCESAFCSHAMWPHRHTPTGVQILG